MEFLQYLIYLFLVFVQLLRVIGGQSVGTPTNATVCNGRNTTLVCDITQSGGANPLWRVFTTSDTNASEVASLINGQNIPPYNYPAIQLGDTVAKLEVKASSSIDGYHFQCRLDRTPPVDSPSTGSITVTELPSCPKNFSANRDGDFTSANVTYQLATTPPGTSTTVTYCPTSSDSPNCGDSVNCTTSPCTISGLNPCVEYNLSAIPTNNCGSATGCTGNSMVVDSQDVPPPLMNVDAQLIKDTSVKVTWNETSSTPTVTSVVVTFCPKSTSDCRNVNCTPSPCTISELMPDTTYDFSFTPINICGAGNASSKSVTTNSTDSGITGTPPPGLPIVVIVVPIVVAIILVVLVVIIVIVVVIWCMKKKHSVKDNSSARMSRLRNNEERANLGEDTYASPGTEKPQLETTDGVYSYAATETKIGAQMKEREQQKKQPPPQGEFYEEPNAAKNVQHKAGTITGETYAQPDKPKRGTKKKNKQQKEPVSHKEAPAGDLYAMPDKKKDVSHTSGPVTGDEYAVASKPKTGGGYGAHGPQ